MFSTCIVKRRRKSTYKKCKWSVQWKKIHSSNKTCFVYAILTNARRRNQKKGKKNELAITLITSELSDVHSVLLLLSSKQYKNSVKFTNNYFTSTNLVDKSKLYVLNDEKNRLGVLSRLKLVMVFSRLLSSHGILSIKTVTLLTAYYFSKYTNWNFSR